MADIIDCHFLFVPCLPRPGEHVAAIVAFSVELLQSAGHDGEPTVDALATRPAMQAQSWLAITLMGARTSIPNERLLLAPSDLVKYLALRQMNIRIVHCQWPA